jgi:uncharacterized membrane protein YkoI
MPTVRELSGRRAHDRERDMRDWSIRILLGSLLFAVNAAAISAGDDDEARDHELARKALLEGRIRALSEIAAAIKPRLPGEILGVKIEVESRERFIYEFDVLTPEGKLKVVDVDATTAEILSIDDED